MITIIIGAIVSLLIFFFEQWWQKNHAIPPSSATAEQFVALVNSKWRFRIISRARRESLALQAHAQFAANYWKNPPVVDLSTALPTQAEAHALAAKYAEGMLIK